MKLYKSRSFTGLILAQLLGLILTSCSYLSMAEDITAPPGSELAAVQPTQPAPSGPLYPLVPPDPTAGESIYLESCAPCHGASGKGDGPQASQLPVPAVPLGSSQIARQSTPAGWYTLVTQGNLERFMPPFNSLSSRQRWDVVAYLYTLSTPPETIALGERLYQAECAACHGESGQGDGPEASNLATAPTNFSDRALMAAKSQAELYQAITEGLSPDMPAFEERLEEDERWALTTYLHSLTFAISGERAVRLEAATDTADQTELTPGTGSVTGEIVLASGGDIPAGLSVTLHGFDNMQETFTGNATVEADGTYTFENVDMPEGRAYITSIEFEGAIYGSDVIVVEEGLTNVSLPIPVFQSTNDSAMLAIDRLHIFFEYYDPDTLRVVELLLITNNGDRTVVPTEDGKPVLTFPLPEGATNLQFEDGILGGRYVEVPGGFGDTAAVRPGAGQHQIVLAFDMPYRRKLDLIQPLSLPVNAVVILVPDDGVKVTGDLLQDAGARDVQGVNYQMYSSERIEAGTELAISISGRPRSAGAGLVAGSPLNLTIGLGAFGLALIVAGLWLYRQNRLGSAVELSGEEELSASHLTGDVSDDPDTLMDAIIALDDLYKAGDLPEEAYQQRRAELKARLQTLVES